MSGRKRHLLVDTPGLLLEVLVHPASVRERAGGEALLARAKARPSCGRLAKVRADGGYDGAPFRDRVRANCGRDLEVVAKPSEWSPSRRTGKASRCCRGDGWWSGPSAGSAAAGA